MVLHTTWDSPEGEQATFHAVMKGDTQDGRRRLDTDTTLVVEMGSAVDVETTCGGMTLSISNMGFVDKFMANCTGCTEHMDEMVLSARDTERPTS